MLLPSSLSAASQPIVIVLLVILLIVQTSNGISSLQQSGFYVCPSPYYFNKLPSSLLYLGKLFGTAVPVLATTTPTALLTLPLLTKVGSGNVSFALPDPAILIPSQTLAEEAVVIFAEHQIGRAHV